MHKMQTFVLDQLKMLPKFQNSKFKNSENVCFRVATEQIIICFIRTALNFSSPSQRNVKKVRCVPVTAVTSYRYVQQQHRS